MSSAFCHFLILDNLWKRKSPFGLEFIEMAKKPQPFKPGDEWPPFEAKPDGRKNRGSGIGNSVLA